MIDIQEKLTQLIEKGWSQAALSDELGVNKGTVYRWYLGKTYPPLPKPVLMALDQLSERKRIPKRRRCAPGEHHTQRKSQEAED